MIYNAGTIEWESIFQAGCRGFESRLPFISFELRLKWRSSKLIMLVKIIALTEVHIFQSGTTTLKTGFAGNSF